MKKVLGAKTPTQLKAISPTKASVAGRIVIDGKERLFLRKSELREVLGDWPKEVDRMLYASRKGEHWLTIVSNESGKSGAEVRVTVQSALQAAQRLANGNVLPSCQANDANPNLTRKDMLQAGFLTR